MIRLENCSGVSQELSQDGVVGVVCLLRRHQWRQIENEDGVCSYCPRCGTESDGDGTGGRTHRRRPPGPPFSLRGCLVRVGARASPAHLEYLRRALKHLELGAWLRERRLKAGRGFGGRDPVHDVAIDLARRRRRVLYLEFGVYKGSTLRYWSSRLASADAVFVGFDSFVGLPEDWQATTPKGSFSAGGAPPNIRDRRVRLVPGWFDTTLTSFTVPEHEFLVINVDCDLYSAATTVLTAMEPHIKRGSLLYFDELNDADHELRALDEFLRRTGLTVEVLARSRSWSHWLFRVTGTRPVDPARTPSPEASATEGTPTHNR